jgi:hypothetical protein
MQIAPNKRGKRVAPGLVIVGTAILVAVALRWFGGTPRSPMSSLRNP